MYSPTLGAYDETQGGTAAEALEYVRQKWAEFLNLGPRIIDLQHRAAIVAFEAQARGDTQSAELARDVIRALGNLNVAHGRAIDTYELERVGDAVGLSAIPTAVVVAPAVALSLAAVVAWAFRAYAAEARKLELIEAGVLTPEQAAALDAGPSPVGVAQNLAKLVGLALAVYIGAQLFGIARGFDGAWRRNPPLEVWRTNPPGTFGDEVYDVRYRHSDDGLNYVHDFGPGVELEGLDDGTVRLYHRDGLPLWDDFEV